MSVSPDPVDFDLVLRLVPYAPVVVLSELVGTLALRLVHHAPAAELSKVVSDMGAASLDREGHVKVHRLLVEILASPAARTDTALWDATVTAIKACESAGRGSR